MSLSGLFWNFTGGASDISGSIQCLVFASTAISFAVYVCKEGIIVPYYINGIKQDLVDVKDILSGLTEEQIRAIDELRDKSEKSLDELTEEYLECCEEYWLLQKDRNDASFITKLWQIQEVRELKRKTKLAINDTYTTTTTRLRRARELATEQRLAREAEESAAATATAAFAMELNKSDDAIELPTLTTVQRPQASFLRGYFPGVRRHPSPETVA